MSGSARLRPGAAVQGAMSPAPRKTSRPAAPEASAPAAEAPAAVHWPEGLIEVGHVLDAWGTRGWIKVAPDAAEPAALLKAPTWWLQSPAARGASRRLELPRRLARRHAQSVVALLEGIAGRDQAEALKGWSIHLRREDFPPAAGDEFYWVDLIGCEVCNREGVALGRVIGLLDSGAQSVLRIRRPEAGSGAQAAERLIPFVGAYIVSVELDARRIVADWQPDYD
jgi:16S rRNA processing protein RimM